MTMTAPSGLARKSVGTSALWCFGVTASSPMTVLAGGVIATYASTGVIGVPLSFLLLGAALSLFTIGYVAMSRHVPHAATFYAFLARGLGRVWGVGGAAVALLAYNCIQISLYGLFGFTLAGLVGGTWWAWALIGWAAVALLGILSVNVNARVLGTVLVVELAVLVLMDMTAFTNPAGGSVSLVPLLPDNLFVDGVGGVLALGVAAFVGYESAPIYSEEARDHQSVSRASFLVLFFLSGFYALSAWALAVAAGPDRVVQDARDPGSGLPFSILELHYGPVVTAMANLLLITSVFAAMLSFHNSVSRYVFALSREQVLPAALGRVGSGRRAGAPIGGSILQSVIALVVVLSFTVAGADPFNTLFTWLSTIAAIGVMLLIAVTSLAVLRFFATAGRHGRAAESVWQRLVAPALGALALIAMLALTVANLSSLLGLPPESQKVWLVPGLVLVMGVVGIGWGVILRVRRPEVYQGIGHGNAKPLLVLDHQLANLEV